MIIADNSFTFQTNVSVDFYQSKSEAKACLTQVGAQSINKQKMAFKRQLVTIPRFLQLATNGYAFCNLFKYNLENYWFTDKKGQYRLYYPEYKRGPNKGGMKLQFKSDQFFEGTQTIFVDVDYTKFLEVSAYITTLKYTPTCVYMSFSDNLEKSGVISRRFRLVYIFESILDREEFIRISETLTEQIIIDTGEPMEDDCGTRMSQYMNGVYGNNETYVSNIVYSSKDFPPEELIVTSISPTLQDINFTQQNPVSFNQKMIDDMEKLSYKDFMHYYSWEYPYLYRIEKEEWIEDLYQLTDESYMQLWWYPEIVCDRQKRRKKLFRQACVRRLMYPAIDPNTLLFNLYVDRERFFDNSDRVLTISTLARKVENSFELNMEQLSALCSWELSYWPQNRPKFIFKQGVKPTQSLINEVKTKIRYAEIATLYNPSLSLQENLRMGIPVPQSTLYRFCNKQGIQINPNKQITESEKREEAKRVKQHKIEVFKEKYDPNLSIRKNQKYLSEVGLQLSLDTIKNWKEKYISLPYVNKQIDNSLSFKVCIPNFNIDFNTHNFDEPKLTDVESNYETVNYVWPSIIPNQFNNWQPPLW